MKKIIVPIAFMIILIGCGTEDVQLEGTTSPTLENKQVEVEETVTLENYGRTLTFDRIPERIVSTNEHTTEILLKLGLEDRIIGVVQREGRHILPEFQKQFERLHVIGKDNPSLEVLLDLSPDFIYGRESTFSSETGVATVEDLSSFDIQSYVDTDSYQEGTTMVEVYQDILNIGRIFHVEDRAIEVVKEMKEKTNRIQSLINDIEDPVRVLVFDQGGEEVFTAGNGSLQTTLITMAGGENIFGDIDKTWARVSWEEVVDRDPEVIVINNYGATTAEEKIAELKNHEHMSDVTAIKENRFVIIDLDSVFAGVRNIDAFELLAKGFYPDEFR